MRMIRPTFLMLLAVLPLSVSALAHPGRYTSLDQAVSQARERYHGRVLSAETERRGGRETHNVRILTPDGRVKNLRIDADSDRPDPPRRR